MKALVLSSGGVDSTTCLAMAIDSLGQENVSALSIWYGQKTQKRVGFCKGHCRLLQSSSLRVRPNASHVLFQLFSAIFL